MTSLSTAARLPGAELGRRRTSATRELYLTKYYFYQHPQAFDSVESSRLETSAGGLSTSWATSNSQDDCDAYCDAVGRQPDARQASSQQLDQLERKYRDKSEESNDDEALGLDYAASDGENMPASCVSQLAQGSLLARAQAVGLTCGGGPADKPSGGASRTGTSRCGHRDTEEEEDYDVVGDSNDIVNNKSNREKALEGALKPGGASCVSAAHAECLVCARLAHWQLALANHEERRVSRACSRDSAGRSPVEGSKSSTGGWQLGALAPDASGPQAPLQPTTQQAHASALTCKAHLRAHLQRRELHHLEPRQSEPQTPPQPQPQPQHQHQHQHQQHLLNHWPGPIYSLAGSAARSSSDQISSQSAQVQRSASQLAVPSRPSSLSQQVQDRRNSSPNSCSTRHASRVNQKPSQPAKLSIEDQLRHLLELAPKEPKDERPDRRAAAMKKSASAKLGASAREQHPSAAQCSHRSRPDANMSPDDRLMIFMLASRSTQTNSTVERNARILKWLNNCRSAA